MFFIQLADLLEIEGEIPFGFVHTEMRESDCRIIEDVSELPVRHRFHYAAGSWQGFAQKIITISKTSETTFIERN